MTTSADIGHGSLFQTSLDAGATYTTFAEVTNIKPPAVKRDSHDASHEQSPNRFRDFIPGMVDGGDVSIDFNLLPAGITALLAEVAVKTVYLRKIVFPDNSFLSFSAFLTDFAPDDPMDNVMKGKATFKVTGQPTFTVV